MTLQWQHVLKNQLDMSLRKEKKERELERGIVEGGYLEGFMVKLKQGNF